MGNDNLKHGKKKCAKTVEKVLFAVEGKFYHAIYKGELKLC